MICMYVCMYEETFNTGQGMFIIQSYPCCGVNKQHMWRSYYLFFFCRWGRREAELCVLERQNYSWFRFILYLHIWHIFWHGSVQKYMEYIISHYVWHKWCIVQDAKICSAVPRLSTWHVSTEVAIHMLDMRERSVEPQYYLFCELCASPCFFNSVHAPQFDLIIWTLQMISLNLMTSWIFNVLDFIRKSSVLANWTPFGMNIPVRNCI